MFKKMFKKFFTFPKPGEIWIFRNPSAKKDPFIPKAEDTVKILEVKKGWVRFSMGNGYFFNDERMSEWMFIFCYRKSACEK